MSDWIRPRFDGESDVAAMVYGPADDPDAALEQFLRRRAGEGTDALGVIQRRSAADPAHPGMPEFLIWPDDERRDSPDVSPSSLASCGTALRSVDARLSVALKRRPDVLALNRFGSLEAAGGGLLGVLAQAIALDVPVVIATPAALFADWLALAEGLTVRLRPDPHSLDSWWRSLGRSAPAPRSDETFCERYK